ncbi:MAG: hypothetical protein HOK28_07255 [Deltaproteobacteria bacterium]|nr:hypothetical protein [Deltaproteobacteria bacterium]
MLQIRKEHRFGILVLLACLFSAQAAPSLAASIYDPALDWRTIESPRFDVHYPDEPGYRNLAIRISRIAEDSLDKVAELSGFMPEGRIDVVVSDFSDEVNGSATVMPRNTLRLYVTAPTENAGLSFYDDWLHLLVVHELAHICDIDQTWGLTRFLRWIFGKYISMNGFTPQFLSEGYAVFAETTLTKTGRGRSSYVAMLLRTAALEDKFLNIDQAHIMYSDWPGGNGAYFYGGLFHLFLAERFGKEKVAELHQFNAAMPIPYFYYPASYSKFGSSLPALWDEFREKVKAEALAVEKELKAKGLTKSREITTHGRNVTGPRYSADGEYIVYSRTSPVDGRTVRQVGRDGSDDKQLILQTFSRRFSFERDGAAFYFSQNAINERFNDFNDIYRYTVENESITKLQEAEQSGKSLRARDPDVSSDGSKLVFVQNKLHQSYVTLGTFTDEQRKTLKLQVLLPAHGDMQHASPRFSPDDSKVVVSSWFPGGHRDIIVVDASTGQILKRITQDRALDANPTWSADGRYVIYDSDRDGIFNLYAYDTQTEAHFRITRVVGGAFQPDVSPDGQSMLFRSASARGFDVHELDFRPETWEPISYEAEAVPPESAGVVGEDGLIVSSFRHEEAPAELLATQQDLEYTPWASLLPFNDNWVLFPALYLYNNDATARFSTFGSDSLAEHRYSLAAWTSLKTLRPSWSASYVFDSWYPTLGISFTDAWQAIPYTLETLTPGTEENTEPEIVRSQAWAIDRRLSISGSMSLPIKNRHLGFLSYRWDRRKAADEASAEELGYPNGGREDFARLEFGYRYSFAKRYPYSVGLEDGRSIALAGRWYSKLLGGEFEQVMFTLDGRTYLNNPLWDNHVLAMRLVAAVSVGPEFREKFYLGGNAGSSFLTAVAENVYSLRGFPLSADRKGTGLAALYLEYRFPLWHVERGLWTLPGYIERFHMAFFTEGGNTFGNGEEEDLGEVFEKAAKRIFQSGSLGVGTEIRADINFGWAFPLTLRTGVALGVLDRGVVPNKLTPEIYFAFGSSI